LRPRGEPQRSAEDNDVNRRERDGFESVLEHSFLQGSTDVL
jgi:hypothetical protein